MAATAIGASADIPLQYYSTLQGKSGEELKTAIHQLVGKDPAIKMLSYGSGDRHTWWGFYVTDRDEKTNEVIDRYSNDVRYYGSRGSSVSGMNIEHSFPKSWWGGTSNNAYTDLYNLMPCEQKINSSKSNYAMGKVVNVSKTNGCTTIGTSSSGMKLWEPADKWKGDFARGYMYGKAMPPPTSSSRAHIPHSRNGHMNSTCNGRAKTMSTQWKSTATKPSAQSRATATPTSTSPT